MRLGQLQQRAQPRHPAPVTPPPPSLSSPSSGASFTTSDTISFSWGTASGAGRYGLAVCTSASLASGCQIFEPGGTSQSVAASRATTW